MCKQGRLLRAHEELVAEFRDSFAALSAAVSVSMANVSVLASQNAQSQRASVIHPAAEQVSVESCPADVAEKHSQMKSSRDSAIITAPFVTTADTTTSNSLRTKYAHQRGQTQSRRSRPKALPSDLRAWEVAARGNPIPGEVHLRLSLSSAALNTGGRTPDREAVRGNAAHGPSDLVAVSRGVDRFPSHFDGHKSSSGLAVARTSAAGTTRSMHEADLDLHGREWRAGQLNAVLPGFSAFHHTNAQSGSRQILSPLPGTQRQSSADWSSFAVQADTLFAQAPKPPSKRNFFPLLPSPSP